MLCTSYSTGLITVRHFNFRYYVLQLHRTVEINLGDPLQRRTASCLLSPSACGFITSWWEWDAIEKVFGVICIHATIVTSTGRAVTLPSVSPHCLNAHVPSKYTWILWTHFHRLPHSQKWKLRHFSLNCTTYTGTAVLTYNTLMKIL
jgi:hypothetical protein